MTASISKKKHKSSAPYVRERHSELLALEQRIVFDAAGAATAAAATPHATPNADPVISDTLQVSNVASTPIMVAPSPGGTTPETGSTTPTGVGFTPAQLLHAYGIDQITFSSGSVVGDGTGQTIAIVDAYNDPNIAADLATFDAAFGIAAPPSFSVLNQTGGGGGLPANGNGWTLEESLDVEWAHAVAPKASIDLVEANSANLSDLLTAITTAEGLPGVSVVSMSFGGGEFAGETADDPTFNNAAVTFVASTGDSGAGQPNFPSSSPYVLAVGGTDITLNGSNLITSETAWNGSVGGISLYESQPGYQNGVVSAFSTTNRTVPDVAWDAGTPVAICDSYDYGATPWVGVEGTSIGAPCWSGIVAIANQGRVIDGAPVYGGEQFLSAVYALPSTDFNDITSGSNDSYSARAGYDLVTGLGTPKANFIMADLNGMPVGTNNTLTTLENTGYTFTTADFGFSDTNGSTLKAVDVTTLPGSGTLTDKGVAVTAGEFISLSDISNHKLVFTPATYAHGAPYSSFTFQVEDRGNNIDGTPRTMTLDVTAVNQAPTGTDNTVSTDENTPYVFGAADFGFSDPHDSPANILLAVEITTLPTHGTLTDNGMAVTAGQFVAVADITGGLLVYTPAANASGAANGAFTFQVEDNGGTANGGKPIDPTPKTMAVNVIAIDQPPAVATTSTVTFLNDPVALNISITPGYGETPGANFTISNIPAGAELIGPGGSISIVANSATVPNAAIGNLTLVPPTNFVGTIALSVTAANTDINATTTSTTQALTITVEDLPQVPSIRALPVPPSFPKGSLVTDNSVGNAINLTLSPNTTFDNSLSTWWENVFSPKISNPVSGTDYTAAANSEITFDVPRSFFSDGEYVSMDARLANGGHLPAWLTFDPEHLTFNGTPPASAAGELNIKIIAQDSQGHKMEVPLHFLIGRDAVPDFSSPEVVPPAAPGPYSSDLPSAPLISRAGFSEQLQQASDSGPWIQDALSDFLSAPLMAS